MGTMATVRKRISVRALVVCILSFGMLWMLGHNTPPWSPPAEPVRSEMVKAMERSSVEMTEAADLSLVASDLFPSAGQGSDPLETANNDDRAMETGDDKDQGTDDDIPVVVDVDLDDKPETRYDTGFVDVNPSDSESELASYSAQVGPGNSLDAEYTFKGVDTEKITAVLSRAKYQMDKMRSNYERLGIDRDMLERAIVRHQTVDKLKNVFTRVLLTQQPMKVGVIGGSISAGACLPSKNNIFAVVFGRVLQTVLAVPVMVRRGAISACGSNYFTYCSTIHVDVDDSDLIIAEHAANDNWKLGSTYSQERLLRFLLRLPKQPQVMYVNFLLGAQMKPNLCFNAELKEITPLSEHYSIPSISLREAICPSQIDRFKELFANDGIHPTITSHEMVSMFMLELILNVLYQTAMDILKAVKTGDKSYMEALNPTGSVRPTELPDRLWPETHDVLSQRCWSTLQPISSKEGALKPAYAPGWTFSVPAKRASDGLSVRSSWYTTKHQQIMAFPVVIDQVDWDGDFSCNVTLFMFTCPTCGSVQVSLYQEDVERDSVVAVSKDDFTGRLRTANIGGVMPGNYTLSMMTMENKPFRLVAIATHCDIP